MITSRQLASALISSVQENPDSQDKILKNFEKFLEKNHLIKLLPNITKFLEEEQKRLEKRDSLEIVTSHKVNKETIKIIEDFVQKKSKSKTFIEEDDKLIGGFIAKYKNMVYDGSIRNHLNQLKAILIK